MPVSYRTLSLDKRPLIDENDGLILSERKAGREIIVLIQRLVVARTGPRQASLAGNELNRIEYNELTHAAHGVPRNAT